MAEEEKDRMTFWDHLEVFRGSALRIVGVLLVFMVGTFIVLKKYYGPFVLGPTTSDFFLYRLFPNFHGDFHVDIININVASQFLTHVSTSFWFALVLAFPYVIWEIWRFVSPALYHNEKRPVRFAFLFGTGMFYFGCAVGYCVVFPFTFRFLTEYQISADVVNQISLNSYMNNFLTLVFVMGLLFEMPLLIWVLSRIGIIDRSFLRKYRRHAIVFLVILAAIITPSGDPFTLTVVFAPLYLLYELGILLARKAQPEEDDTPTDKTPVPTPTAPRSEPSDASRHTSSDS
jgi:sec-independent protein translocase protein TatC